MPPTQEWFDTDYYRALGVSSEATAKEITKAYRKLARKYHPDATGGDDARFKEISAAYSVLGDEAKRAEYDEVRRLGPGAFAPGGFAGGTGGFSVRVDDMGDASGWFANLFDRASRGGARMAMRGVDLESRLHLKFADAVTGVTTTVAVAAPESGTKRVQVRIPAGVEDGQRLRIAGKGGAGRNGGPPGDLWLNVEVAPDATFGRDGKNLTLTVPITYPEAVLGGTVKVPTFDGSSVTLKVPPATKSNTTLRVAGRGIATRRGSGDLMVTVEIAVPTDPSAAERDLLNQLAEVTDYSTDESDEVDVEPDTPDESDKSDDASQPTDVAA